MIIALVTLITGGNVLFFILLLISLIGMTELYKVFGIEKKPPGLIGYIAALAYYGLVYFEAQLPGEKQTWFMLLFMAFLICEMRRLCLHIRNIIPSRYLLPSSGVLCGG